MFSFISQSPPETTLLLGLSTGALIGETVKKLARKRAERIAG
jgi:hypothetical protein